MRTHTATKMWSECGESLGTHHAVRLMDRPPLKITLPSAGAAFDGEADCGGRENGTEQSGQGAWRRGVTPQQDGIGCYATGHQSYLYTSPLVPTTPHTHQHHQHHPIFFFFFFYPPQAPLPLWRTARFKAPLWDAWAPWGVGGVKVIWAFGVFVPLLNILS